MKKKELTKISTVGFDHGYHVELPIPIEVDPKKLNSNIAIRIAEIFVHELNALGYKVSWRKNPKI